MERIKGLLTKDGINDIVYIRGMRNLTLKNYNLVKTIKTKNEALLNCKHDNDIVRHHCNLILKGKPTYEDR